MGSVLSFEYKYQSASVAYKKSKTLRVNPSNASGIITKLWEIEDLIKLTN